MRAIADLIASTPEAVVWEAIGLVLSGGLILLWAALKLTPSKIGE